MAFGVYTPLYGLSLSGVSAQVNGSALDMRAGNGRFLLQISASGTNAGFGNSAHLTLDHSLDRTGWLTFATITASGTGTYFQTVYSAGAYAYVRVSTLRVYSGATGTGVVWAWLFGNNQGGD